MMNIIILAVAVLLIGFFIYVATRPALFAHSESAVIKASPEKIFPYISQLKLGGNWSPYEKRDQNMKKTFSGNDGAPGSKLVFDGKKDVGAGSVEILSLVPNSEVKLRLLMSRPMKADNLITYKIEPVGQGTRFTWSMQGENGFFGKLFVTLVDCRKMLSKDMQEGFQNLRKIVE
jgi:hypothetical protein